jgi:hypothetical protein
MKKLQRLADISQHAVIIATRIKKLSRPNPKPTRNRENQRTEMILRFAVRLAMLRAEWYIVASQPEPSFRKGGNDNGCPHSSEYVLVGREIEKLNQNQTHAK